MQVLMVLDVVMVSELFFYQQHWDAMAVAKSMSSEPWSWAFFTALRSEHQEHYEIGTSATGTIRIRQQPFIHDVRVIKGTSTLGTLSTLRLAQVLLIGGLLRGLDSHRL